LRAIPTSRGGHRGQPESDLELGVDPAIELVVDGGPAIRLARQEVRDLERTAIPPLLVVGDEGVLE
jgi:hypothetical protein